MIPATRPMSALSDLNRTLLKSMQMTPTSAALHTFGWVGTVLQNGAHRTIYCSVSAKPRLLFLGKKKENTHTCLHQWSRGGAGEQF